MLVEEAQHLFRMLSEVIAAVPEARLAVFSIQNSSFSALEIGSNVFSASSGFFVQASSSTWNVRTGIVTAEANSWEFISAAVYAPLLIDSKSISSKYWLIPWSSENPRFFHFKVSI